MRRRTLLLCTAAATIATTHPALALIVNDHDDREAFYFCEVCNALSALRTKGLIEPGPSPLAITSAGLDALGAYDPLPTGPELLHYWASRVGKAERAVLEALANNGTATKDVVAARAGYAPDGGGFNNALSRLRTLGLITGRGTLELHEDLR